jgi:hypothetical protein
MESLLGLASTLHCPFLRFSRVTRVEKRYNGGKHTEWGVHA